MPQSSLTDMVMPKMDQGTWKYLEIHKLLQMSKMLSGKVNQFIIETKRE